jgi:transposase
MRYELSDYEWTAIKPMLPNKAAWHSGLCCKDDRRRWEDGDKLDPISFMRRYRKER